MRLRCLLPLWAIACAGLLGAGAARSEVRTETVEYRQGDAVLEGFIAYDDAKEGPRPAVLIFHEWWGINDYMRRRAQQLAEDGYLAFAADIYGKGQRTTSPEEAGKLAGIYYQDRALMRARAAAGLETLSNHPLADKGRIAAIGYCFGGSVALELARSGAELAGAVSFHGNLSSQDPADARNIKAPVLVLHGGADRYVPPEQVQAFWKEMEEAGADYQIHIYDGAAHAFTNPDAGSDPSTGLAYNEKADRRSWRQMRDFFAEIFK